MTDEMDQLLKNLRLRKIFEMLDEELGKAEKTDCSYQALLLRLFRAQWHYNQQQALAWRIDRARLPEKWTLESFPFKKQPGVSQRQIRTFAELDFVAKAENIVFIGPTGVGKTGLASGLLLKALQNGHRGLFIRAQDLFDEMYASLADRSSRKLINRLARVDVLVVDEMGYLNLKPEQTNIFFKLMEERYRRKATIITTNLKYELPRQQAARRGTPLAAPPSVPHHLDRRSVAPRSAEELTVAALITDHVRASGANRRPPRACWLAIMTARSDR